MTHEPDVVISDQEFRVHNAAAMKHTRDSALDAEKRASSGVGDGGWKCYFQIQDLNALVSYLRSIEYSTIR